MNRQDYRIIVEGTDGSGKTSLVQRLMRDFPDLILVRNPLDDKQDFGAWWPQELDRQKSAAVPIHDRFFYSELVYGPIIRKKINAPQALIDNVALFLRHTSFLVYARPHSDIIRLGIQQLEQMDGVKENFDDILGLYDQIMNVERQWFKDRFFQFDWNTDGHYFSLVQTLKEYLSGELR